MASAAAMPTFTAFSPVVLFDAIGPPDSNLGWAVKRQSHHAPDPQVQLDGNSIMTYREHQRGLTHQNGPA